MSVYKAYCRIYQAVLKLGNCFPGYHMPEYIEGPGCVRQLPELLQKDGVRCVIAANPLSCLAGYTAIQEIERTNACEIAGEMGDRLCDGLKDLLKKYGLPFAAYNQGSIVHLECTGAMSFDFSSMSFLKSALGLLKHKDMMYVRKDSMERMGAAYMANGIVTLAGSRLYTSLADTPELIDEALNRFEEVFKHVEKTDNGLLK